MVPSEGLFRLGVVTFGPEEEEPGHLGRALQTSLPSLLTSHTGWHLANCYFGQLPLYPPQRLS